MTAINLTQGATIAVVTPPAAPSRITQFASFTVQGPAFAPSLISQFAVISVVANNKKSLSLGPAIQLNCWQPCTAYGTSALIVYSGG